MINIPTAKAFTNYIKLGEPYSRNGKKYIKVQKNAKEPIKEVRWYTNNEYYKKYAEMPKAEIDNKKAENPYLFEFFIKKGTKNKQNALNWLWTIPNNPAPPLHWYISPSGPFFAEIPPEVAVRLHRFSVDPLPSQDKSFDLYEEAETDPEALALWAEMQAEIDTGSNNNNKESDNSNERNIN